MPRNGVGDFSLVTNSWNPAISGNLAAGGDWQSLINDVAAAITQSVSRDGQSPLTGNLQLGNNKITGVAAGTGTGEALAFQQLFSQGVQTDLASASTTDIGAQNTNFLRITGNTTITSFGSNYRGPRFLVFEGAVTLTNSSTLVLPGNANITTAAGDVLIAIPGATLGTADKWIVAAYQAATGYLKSNNPSYTGTLTGGTGVVNLGSGQFYKDASGNVGIGTSSPASKLDLSNGDFRITGPGGGGSETTYGNVIFAASSHPNSGAAIRGYNTFADNGGLIFQTSFGGNRTERARIDSSGRLLLGTTSTDAKLTVQENSTDIIALKTTGTNTGYLYNSTSASTSNAAFFIKNSNGVGSINCSSSSTSYLTSSDYRLKEAVQPMVGALATVIALKPCTYKWKVDGSDGQGFIAHELAEVVPQCVSGEKDAVNEDGSIKPQGIDTSFLVATLTAAIQEQQAIITALTARVAALEAA